MAVLDYVIYAIWLSPFFYLLVLLSGKYFKLTRRNNLIKQKGLVQKKIEKIIFQIPTVGNFQSANKAFQTVKGYNLPLPVETWVVIEEWDTHKDQYVCDKVVVVPKDFECEDLYKARALEYARRLRKEMVANGELTFNYILLQGDDDALPSVGFIQEGLTVDADISIGTITTKVVGVWNTIMDYERCVTCGIFCNFFTNLGQPLFAHGEGTMMSAKVDQEVSYDISLFTKNTKWKLISSEDTFYFHKAAILGFDVYNSEERVFALPPLSVGDAVKQRRRWFWGQWTLMSQKNAAVAKQVATRDFRFLRLVALFYRDVGGAFAILWRYPSSGGIHSVTCFYAFDLVRDESVSNRSRHGLETRDYWLFVKLCYRDFKCLYSTYRSVEGRPTQL